MPSSRKSTPRRGRSSSVASNVSTTSVKHEKSATPRRSKTSATAKEEEEPPAAAASSSPAIARPALPTELNPALPAAAVPVKLQVIRRDGQNIIIGRVKLPTVGGTDHAFLLKRFDTDAIAASSMFRLAFPYADGEAERGEMAYLEKKFDADVANGGYRKVVKKARGRPSKKNAEQDSNIIELPKGSTGVKLQGTWIPCADAMEVAVEYGLVKYAQPLIEAKASQAEGGQPILTPSKHDKISSPSSTKKSRKSTTDENSSPTASKSRSTKRAKEDGSGEVGVLKKTLSTVEAVSGLSTAQIQAQIKEAQQLVKGIQTNGETSSSSRKRRAVNQAPTAELDHLADEEYETSNAVVRSLRKGGRAVRRRPIVTTAGALSAVGAGTLAWISGGNIDVATNILQQGVASLQSWFF